MNYSGYLKDNEGNIYYPRPNIKITTGIEFETGRIIDGKTEYGMIKNLGTAPNNERKDYSTVDLSSSFTVSRYLIYAKNKSNKQILSIPFIALNLTDMTSAYLNDAKNIPCKANWDMSNFDLWIEIYYFKK